MIATQKFLHTISCPSKGCLVQAWCLIWRCIKYFQSWYPNCRKELSTFDHQAKKVGTNRNLKFTAKSIRYDMMLHSGAQSTVPKVTRKITEYLLLWQGVSQKFPISNLSFEAGGLSPSWVCSEGPPWGSG